MTRKKPTALKVLHGTDRPDRCKPNEPKGEDLNTKPPSWMNAKEKKWWKEFVDFVGTLKICTQSDRPALEMLVTSYSEWRQLRDICFPKKGMDLIDETYGRHGEQRKMKPEYQAMNNAWKKLDSMLKEFGMTPVARTRVEEVKKDEKKKDGIRDTFFQKANG